MHNSAGKHSSPSSWICSRSHVQAKVGTSLNPSLFAFVLTPPPHPQVALCPHRVKTHVCSKAVEMVCCLCVFPGAFFLQYSLTAGWSDLTLLRGFSAWKISWYQLYSHLWEASCSHLFWNCPAAWHVSIALWPLLEATKNLADPLYVLKISRILLNAILNKALDEALGCFARGLYDFMANQST